MMLTQIVEETDSMRTKVDGNEKLGTVEKNLVNLSATQTTALKMIANNAKNSWLLSGQLTVPEEYQLAWDNPYYTNSFTFSKGFIHNIYVYNIFYNGYQTIRIENIVLDELPFENAKFFVTLTHTGGGEPNYLYTGFADGVNQYGWSVISTAEDAISAKDELIGSMPKISASPARYESGLWSANRKVTIPVAGKGLLDLSKQQVNGVEFCVFILISKIPI